jgi:hypothetical protein
VRPVYFCFIFPQPNEREEKLMKARKKIATGEALSSLSRSQIRTYTRAQANVCPFVLLAGRLFEKLALFKLLKLD